MEPCTSELSQFLGVSLQRLRCICSRTHIHTLRYIHVYMYIYALPAARTRENHGKGEKYFLNKLSRIGIPRRCAEQNDAVVACETKGRREKKGNRGMVDRSVGRSGKHGVRLVKMQTSRFDVDTGARDRSWSLRDPMLSLRLRYVQKVGRGL